MRDSSNDINDPDANLADPEWHHKEIMKAILLSLGIAKVGVKNGRLYFQEGIFGASWLRRLIKPNMKGFWVPISVESDATLMLKFDELIGLQNCSEHVSGSLIIASQKMQSFDLSTIETIHELDIAHSSKLNDLSKLPYVLTALSINKTQLKGNLKHLINAASSRCRITVSDNSSASSSMKSPELERILTHALHAKAGRKNLNQVLIDLQTALLDHGYDEYADL